MQGPFNWDFMVVAHEIGHNFYVTHTHNYCPPLDICAPPGYYGQCQTSDACIPDGTLMSYCHLCPGGTSNITTYFHTVSAAEMRAAAEVSCFASVGGPSFCDASDGALASCPCLNVGNPDAGCDSPIPAMQGGGTTGGIRLDALAQQTSPTNAATLTGSGYPSLSAPGAVVIRSNALDGASPVIFGDGLRCIGLPLTRLGGAVASAGTSTHAFGHSAMTGPGTFYYQVWYRSQPSSYCDPVADYNLSNGQTLVW
jgi:hypothetical protein